MGSSQSSKCTGETERPHHDKENPPPPYTPTAREKTPWLQQTNLERSASRFCTDSFERKDLPTVTSTSEDKEHLKEKSKLVLMAEANMRSLENLVAQKEMQLSEARSRFQEKFPVESRLQSTEARLRSLEVRAESAEDRLGLRSDAQNDRDPEAVVVRMRSMVSEARTRLQDILSAESRLESLEAQLRSAEIRAKSAEDRLGLRLMTDAQHNRDLEAMVVQTRSISSEARSRMQERISLESRLESTEARLRSAESRAESAEGRLREVEEEKRQLAARLETALQGLQHLGYC